MNSPRNRVTRQRKNTLLISKINYSNYRALAGFPILEGGVAILYDPRRIKMIKKNAGHFKVGKTKINEKQSFTRHVFNTAHNNNYSISKNMVQTKIYHKRLRHNHSISKQQDH